MSVVHINGTTYENVEVIIQGSNDPKSLTFMIPKGNLDLDTVAADFSSGDTTITVDENEYKGYTMFRSLAYDLEKIVVLVSQKTMEEQLTEANAQIEELQDATAEILEIIGG